MAHSTKSVNVVLLDPIILRTDVVPNNPDNLKNNKISRSKKSSSARPEADQRCGIFYIKSNQI